MNSMLKKSWWGHQRPSDEYLTKLILKEDDVEKQVSKYPSLKKSRKKS